MSDFPFELWASASQHDLAYQMVTSALLWASGDLLAQSIERYNFNKQHHSIHQSNSSSSTSFSLRNCCSQWNVLRTFRLSLFGSCVWAFCTYYWFRFLEEIFPGEGFKVALQRMILDQSVYAPCVIFTLFIVIGLLEGLSFQQLFIKTKSGFIPTLLSNWILWPIAQLVIQGIIPLKQRIIVANLINIPWTAYLAYKAAIPPNSPTIIQTNKTNANNTNKNTTINQSEEEEQLELMQIK